MKQDEFDRYLEKLIQNAKSLVLPGTPYGKAQFQGAVLGLLACDKEHTFTGKQVAEIINTALNYKSPGNEGSAGEKVKILQVNTMDEIENMMTKSHSIAARTARNYIKEEVRKYEALRDHRGNFRAADDGRGFRAGSEDDSGHNGRIGL